MQTTQVLTGTSIPLYDSRFDSGSERVKMFSSRPFMRKSVPVVKQDKVMASQLQGSLSLVFFMCSVYTYNS